MSISEDHIADLTQSVQDLTETVNDKLSAIDARVAAAEAALDARANAAEADYEAFKDGVLMNRPALNLLSDSGRFAGNDDAFERNVGPFVPPSYFTRHNGASTPIEVGRYRYASADLGGTVTTPLAQTVIDLANAMPVPSGSRAFLSEFYVAEVTAGPGTNLPSSVGPNLFNIGTRRIHPSGPGNYYTRAIWVRAIDGDLAFAGNTSISPRFNGVENPDGILTVSDGWMHISVSGLDYRGHANHWPYIYASPGHRVQFALPFISPGIVTGVHTSPVPSPIAGIID